MSNFSNSFHHRMRVSLFALILVLTHLFGAPTAMAGFFGKSELSSPWKERFQDVSKLNEYTRKGLKTEISDTLIKDYDLVGAEFVNATFRYVEWNNTSIEGMVINNGRFIENTFNGAYFNDAKLTNVTFEDSEFNGVYFHGAQMIGVKFIRCKFTAYSEADFMFLKNSNVEFEYTTFEAEEMGHPKITFLESNAALTFRNSTLTKVSLTDLAFPSTLTFENSKLQDVEMSRSKLAKLVMDGVTGGGRSGFGNGGSIAEVEVRNSDMGFSLGEGVLNKLTFGNSSVDVNFRSAHIKEISIVNCKGMRDLTLSEANIDSLQITNCPVNELVTTDADIQNFSIDKSSIVNSKLKRMKVKHFTLTDVTLDQKIDFTGAQVENLVTRNITKLPNLNLNLTGSNVKF